MRYLGTGRHNRWCNCHYVWCPTYIRWVACWDGRYRVVPKLNDGWLFVSWCRYYQTKCEWCNHKYTLGNVHRRNIRHISLSRRSSLYRQNWCYLWIVGDESCTRAFGCLWWFPWVKSLLRQSWGDVGCIKAMGFCLITEISRGYVPIKTIRQSKGEMPRQRWSVVFLHLTAYIFLNPLYIIY